MGFQQIAAGNDPYYLARVVPLNDRKAADSLQHHLVGGVSQGAILVDYDWRTLDERLDPDVVRHGGVEEIPPRDDSNEKPIRIDDRVTLMREATSRLRAAARVRGSVEDGEGGDFLVREIADESVREMVRCVLRANRHAAPRELLGHDRVTRERERCEVGRRRAKKNRKEADRLTRRLECEDHRREQRV